MASKTDRDALVALFRSARGASWRKRENWDTDAALSTWFGVKVNGEGRVVQLALPDNNLQGAIPAQLGALTKLTWLNLSNNGLHGPIPKELGALSKLEQLVLSSNGLVGSIPPELGKLAALQDLDLSRNQLTGSIPKELGDLRELRELWLNSNQLTGPIPEELGKLTALEKLFLNRNNLSGPIPEKLGKLEALQYLDLEDNKLRGPIPKELGALGRLEKLQLNSNNLTGHIPPQLGDLSALTHLYLNSNKLDGSIPPDLGKLAALESLSLTSNQLTGPIPSELGNLSALETLYLSGNNLTGHIPPQLGDLSALTHLNLNSNKDLYLNSNKLDGPIPRELGNLAALQSLDLGSNTLRGHIPPQLGDLSALRHLSLNSNKLDGSIPPELGKLAALQRLYLWGNQLTGPIPPELGGLSKLEQLVLEHNKLTGRIPPELGKLAALEKLSLGQNQLSGHIPPELGALSELQYLWLKSNKLTGPIPEELGKLSAVTVLVLGSNSLSGAIPAQLGALTKLTWLKLSNNGLDGHIPPQLGDLSALTHLYLNSNKLDGPIPKELGALSKLEQLVLSSNGLTGAIPAQLGALNKLAWLDLSNNQLSGPIPKELGALSALRELRLYKNQLSGHIPPQLGDLGALQYLSLSGNELDGHIPPQLGQLGALQYLVLPNNELDGHIPPQLGQLGALKYLNLYGNKLDALWDHTQDAHGVGNEEGANSKSGGAVPRRLRRLLDVLGRCNDLNLDANPWTEPPESIVIKGATGIRGYFEDLYAEPCRIQRNSVKIILVGQEGAGKTSLRQSMKANKAAPTGEWEEESTVVVDVEPMELEGASVRVYDCAGQVAYTGLLQVFLTPRSVCVLVCNAEAFQNPDQGVGDQVEKDCRKLEELCVCDWLRSISRRVPGNDVIFVATKCDMVGGNPRDTGRRMEEACQQWLSSWVRDGMQAVRVENGVCLTSCFAPRIDVREGGNDGEYASEGGWACDWRDSTDDNPSPSLLHRLVNQPNGGGLRGAQMVLPRSWGIALTILEALERGRDPVEAIVRKLADPDEREAASTAPSKVEMYRGITVEELSAKWLEAVLELEKREITVTNAEHALEGALSIREFDGSLIRHETFVFLDVVWLSRILKPLLNHKDTETFEGFVKLGDNGDSCITLHDQEDIASWLRLKSEGILEPRLARVIWPAGLSEYVLPTLVSLGLTFPLENDDAGGLVVLLRLKSDRPARVGKVIDTFCSQNTPVFSASWKIFLGVPAGAMEKVLTRCCSVGGVQTFWRFGVLVHGSFGDARDGSGDFAVVLEYSSANNELTAQVYGDKSQPAPWAALSYVISAMRFVLLEFPGLRWRGILKCPQHGDPMLLDSKATRTGDQLLLESAGCRQCSPKIRGQGAAAIKLLRMVDIRLERDVVFDEVKARFLECEYYFSRPTTSSEGDEAVIRKMDKRFDEVTGQLGKLADDVRDGFEEVKGGLDKVAESLQKSLRCLKNLQAPNFPYPHLVVVEEVETQGKRSLLEKLRGKFKKDMALYFLCPVDMSKVPCGVGGEGYRFCKTRDWVKRLSPVLQVAVVTAKVALKATSGIEVDVSDFLRAVNEGLVEEVVDRTLDEETLLRVVSGEEDADNDLRRDTRASFEALKKFMEKEESNRRKTAKDGDGYVNFEDKMKRVDDGKRGLVWVRTENVEQWRQTLRSTAAPSG